VSTEVHSAPWQIPLAGWWQIVKRVWASIGRDRISLIAAGVAFYSFLSFVPLLAAVVLVYGLAADPVTLKTHMSYLFTMMPEDAASIVSGQMRDMVVTAGSTKGWALAVALATSLFGISKAATAIITAIRLAYDEQDTRGFFQMVRMRLIFTVGLVSSAFGLLILSGVMVLMGRLLDGGWAFLAQLAIWALGTATVSVLVALAYRHAPDRVQPHWRWLTPGSMVVAVGALLLTTGFSLYVARFSSYNATYGALGAVVAFLFWLYLLALLLYIGAKLDAEAE